MNPLLLHLSEYNGCQNVRELEEALRDNYEENLQFIRSLQLKTNHLRPVEKNFPVQVAFLTRKSARSLMAFKGEMRVTVYQFYYLRHRRRLLYPQLPCIAVMGGNGHVSFYPLEVIDAAAIQKAEKVKFEYLEKNNLPHFKMATNIASNAQTNADEESTCYEEEEEQEAYDDGAKIVIKMASMTF